MTYFWFWSYNFAKLHWFFVVFVTARQRPNVINPAIRRPCSDYDNVTVP